jgi:hypothetical protein
MAGLAPSLVNLSYALALMGQFHHARLLAREAEGWARRSGKEYVLALALNARAQVEEHDGRIRDALRYNDRALKIAEGLRIPRVRGLVYMTRARAHRHFHLTEEQRNSHPQALEEALKEANQAVSLLRNNPPDRVTALIERGCMHREIAQIYYAQQQEVEAVQSARRSQKDFERAIDLTEAMDLSDQQALARMNLAWLWYYTGQIDKVNEILKQTYSSIPSEYAFPARGAFPPMAQEKHKDEARLPFWIALGKAEMLKAYLALDEAQSTADEKEQEEKLTQAVLHIALSLAYKEQVASESFDLRRAEGELHRRILQDELNIGGLQHYAQQAAAAQGLKQPTRFQEFLNRMFGPADLWA